MDGYKHYIRVNQLAVVIHGFSDAFEQPQEGDIVIAEDAGRHFQTSLITERGQYRYTWDSSQLVERTQTELDAEWAARPEEPDPDAELAEAIQAAATLDDLKAALLGNGKLARVKGKMKSV